MPMNCDDDAGDDDEDDYDDGDDDNNNDDECVCVCVGGQVGARLLAPPRVFSGENNKKYKRETEKKMQKLMKETTRERNLQTISKTKLGIIWTTKNKIM